MSVKGKLGIAALIAALVLVFGIGRGWFRNSARPVKPTDAPTAVSKVHSARTNKPAFLASRPRPRPRPARTNMPAPATISLTDTNQIANWEETLDELLRDDSDVTGKAKKLLGLLPRFPEDGQVEAAQHISNLLADEDYTAFGQLLTSTNTLAGVQEVVMADLLNRPNGVKLPTLLEVARNPDLSKAAEALELLKLHLDDDLGNNWDAWQQKLEQWLKEHPE